VFWPKVAGTTCTLPGGAAGICDGGKVLPGAIEPLEEGECVAAPPPVHEVFIPLDALSEELNLALNGTTIQVSHTTGTPANVPENVNVCTVDNAILGDCIEACKTVGCKSACLKKATTCTTACEDVSSLSYIAWGPIARMHTPQGGGFSCDTTTCPSCATPTVIDLPNQPVDVAPYSAHNVTCRVNDWVFAATNAHKVTVTTGGGALAMEMHGSAPDPAVQCTNGPDMHVDSIGLKITVSPTVDASGAIQVTSVGELDTTFSPAWWAIPIDWFVDFDGTIKAGVKERMSEKLNTSENRTMLSRMVTGLINKYLTDYGKAPAHTFYELKLTSAGLDVKYDP
jgi:hypothetical protein